MKIFYLHGMGGSPRDWRWVEKFSPGHALPIEMLPFDESAASIARQLQNVAEPFILCGYSMGGRLGIRVATKLQNPAFRGLVLLAAGLGFAEEKERLARTAADENWALAARQPDFWEKWYNQEIFATFGALPESLKSEWMKDRLCLDIEHLSSQFRLLAPGQHEDLGPELLALKKKPISLLYIAGERDKKYSKLATSIPGIRSEILEGGHILPLEAPEAVAKSLKKFVERLGEEK